ncbi:two-component system, NtrC family, C4-dicarboxylate transport sensor histidine kinase DctB [Vibrio xiamenensis]|uniref:C4-dicarboxylate transport sensor protein DctB n=1 Tax=Vibrio xiamenensis TaxID=861298 RepID=A0A1G7ZCG2_9VIBR|nr:ATP-binding protein [Vibrio xiamenensis]SDH06315.1 two-component system, NtrC family, C4-dicarboxylate transport sensor histidine kinase DctB [Vibrio xiamenensis]
MSPSRKTSGMLLVLFVAITLISWFVVWNHQYRQLVAEHQAQLDKFTNHIVTKLDKYAHIPQLLSKDKELVLALQNQHNTAQIEVTNRYLEQVNAVIEAEDTYLLNQFGTTIAASNWDLSRTFVGRNFAWRPYFQQAIQGQTSQYFALGTTSGSRGYYYSHPVTYAAENIGVIVVKMDLSSIEDNWQSTDSSMVATDQYNVVFMASEPSWLFHSLTDIDESQRSDLIASRQYFTQPIPSLGLIGNLSNETGELTNRFQGGWFGDYLVTSRPIPGLKLTFRVLTPKRVLFWSTASFVLVEVLLFSVVYLTYQLIRYRRQRQRQFEHIQYEAKQKLEFLVMERTAELHAEVLERTRTEQQLRQTQNELVQAAKLAVLGQMSASISHELNNPLAAIRSFADNGRRFLAKQQGQRVDENLSRISELTERMAKISQQLKSFARKSDSSDQVRSRLSPLVHSAIELLSVQLKTSQVDCRFTQPNMPIWVMVNPIQLEQVLINLVTNAEQALLQSQQSERQIEISIVDQHQQVAIHIDDNGPGISAETRDKLFEPFYTTKKNGLGLGLSISQQILRAMNGELLIDRSPLNGARFSILLPIHRVDN